MYQNQATANSQALIVFLLDISGSMGKPMGGSTRIQVVKDALKMTITEMVQRSLKNKVLRPRYRVAMIAYSDDVYDVLGGVKTIDQVAKMGVPKLEPLNKTDVTKGLHFVKQLLEKEKANVTNVCPAPLVIHMTDGDFTSKEEPEPVVKEIQKIAVDDGPVLIENLFVSDDLVVAVSEAATWPGYKPGEDLKDKEGKSIEDGNRLLSMSSPLPEMYRIVMNELGYAIKPGTLMMYPGTNPRFVQMAF